MSLSGAQRINILLQEINLRLNKLFRICRPTSNTKFCRISPLHKNLNLLKLTYLYNFELAKFFHLLVHDELPSVIYENFTKVHDHNTKRSKEIVYFVPRFSKSLAQNHILRRGTKLWNELDKNLKKMHFQKDL